MTPAASDVTIKVRADTSEAVRRIRSLNRAARRAGLVSPYFVLLGVLLGFALGLLAAVLA